MMTSRRGNQIYLNEKLSTREVGSIGAEGAVEKVLSGIANSLFDEVIFEEAIDFTWLLRTGQMNVNEVYNIKPLTDYFPAVTNTTILKKEEKKSASVASNKSVTCNICSESVAGTRFAQHLERCMNGGKRGMRKNFDFLRDKVKVRVKKEVVDPDPRSPIVRIKLKNGLPVSGSKHMGVSIEDFVAASNNSKNAPS